MVHPQLRRMFFYELRSSLTSRRTVNFSLQFPTFPTKRQFFPQQQSRPFSLPRELRDEIYRHLVHEEDGWIHNTTSNKLYGVDLSLSYTCRLAAAELEGLALRTNKITILTAHSKSKDDSWPREKIGCKVLRLNELRSATKAMKLCIIALGAAHATSDVVRRIRQKFPSDTICYAAQAIWRGEMDVEGFRRYRHWNGSLSALDDILQLISEELKAADFADLAVRAEASHFAANAHLRNNISFLPNSVVGIYQLKTSSRGWRD